MKARLLLPRTVVLTAMLGAEVDKWMIYLLARYLKTECCHARFAKEAAGHRLALELECLLLDCKDNVVVSRWMDTACEALDAWQRLFPYNGPRLGD
jgi:hypothetical protein